MDVTYSHTYGEKLTYRDRKNIATKMLTMASLVSAISNEPTRRRKSPLIL